MKSAPRFCGSCSPLLVTMVDTSRSFLEDSGMDANLLWGIRICTASMES